MRPVSGSGPRGDRFPFVQPKQWDKRRGLGGICVGSPYAEDRCCWCYREVRSDARLLRLTRTNDGEWWLLATERLPADDELQFGIFRLPIGPDCLGAHPEFDVALVPER